MFKPQCQTEAGFSLLETLVVLVLLGLLFGLVSGGLKTAIIAGPHLTAIDTEAEELEDVSRYLRRLLSQSRPISVGNDGEETVRFHGTGDQVEFLAPLAQRFGPADIVSYVLSVKDGHTLELSWRLDRDDARTSADSIAIAGQEADMLKGLQSPSFQYFGCGGEPSQLGWWNDWTGRPTLPAMIQVQFQWKGEDERIITDLRIEAASGFSVISRPVCLK